MNAVKEDRSRVYTVSGKKRKLIGVKIAVNGTPALGYVKNGELESYITFPQLSKILLEGKPEMNFTDMKK